MRRVPHPEDHQTTGQPRTAEDVVGAGGPMPDLHDPEFLSPEARAREVALLLATGYLRLRTLRPEAPAGAGVRGRTGDPRGFLPVGPSACVRAHGQDRRVSPAPESSGQSLRRASALHGEALPHARLISMRLIMQMHAHLMRVSCISEMLSN